MVYHHRRKVPGPVIIDGQEEGHGYEIDEIVETLPEGQVMYENENGNVTYREDEAGYHYGLPDGHGASELVLKETPGLVFLCKSGGCHEHQPYKDELPGAHVFPAGDKRKTRFTHPEKTEEDQIHGIQ